MKNIHLVLIIAILILIYLISIQWLGEDTDTATSRPYPQEVTEVPLPPVMTETPEEETPEVIKKEIMPEVDPVIPEEVLSETDTVVEAEEATEEIQNSDLVEYKNTNYGYHFSMSDQMYYAGFGSINGALHTVAIQPDTLPESFEEATVRVSYYGKKILPELQNAQRYVGPDGKYVLLLIDDTYSVKLEADNLQSPTVKTIEATIGVD